MKKLLILQFRPETEVSDDEFRAFLKYGKLQETEVERIRAEFDLPKVELGKYSAVIIGGSPYTISDKEKSKEQEEVERKLLDLMLEIYEKDFPYLGNCYGHSTMAQALAKNVSKEKYSETAGAVSVFLTDEGKKDKLLQGVESPFYAFVGHKEACQYTPEGATLLAYSETCPTQMIRYKENAYSTQFHVELDYEGLALRMDYYKNKGYFPPEDVEKLKEEARKHKIIYPMKIMENFVKIYHKSQNA